MILILTCDGDVSSDLVIDVLKAKNAKYMRINSHDFINEKVYFEIGTKIISIGQKKIDIEKIKIVWYRKFGHFEDSNYYKKIKKVFHENSVNQLKKEFYTTINYFLSLFKTKKWITYPWYKGSIKPESLDIALKVGLKIPKTYLMNSKDNIYNINNELITKSIKDPDSVLYKNDTILSYFMFTSLINKNEDIPDNFFISYVQNKVDKEYELRIFYLNQKIYSAAIFSQQDKETEIDFRKYNRIKPNRYLPYNLPQEIKAKLINYMEYCNLNCGSIDMIKGTDGEYYFLEVNPVGQFGMIDFPCNFGLHELLAHELINS